MHNRLPILIILFLGNGQDYDSGQYNITFAAGVVNISFGIQITDDQVLEQDEFFVLSLHSLFNNNNITVGNVSQAVVIILNTDSKYLHLITNYINSDEMLIIKMIQSSCLVLNECYVTLFTIADSVCGSVFYLIIGAHGLHVIIGSVF